MTNPTFPHRETFPIKADCSKCGHKGELFVDDNALYLELDKYRKERTSRIWASFFVAPRLVALIAVVLALGFALGRWAR